MANAQGKTAVGTFIGEVSLNFLGKSFRNSKRLVNLMRLKSKLRQAGVAPSPYWEIGRRGRCRLLHFHPAPGVKQVSEPLLLIPSLINRYYILDLLQGSSIVEELLSKGIPVYLLDWGSPRDQDRFATMEDHILNWMDWAVDKVLRHAECEQLKLFGQCVGGTFSAVYSAMFPQKISGLALLTTPIDFNVQGVLGTWANQSQVDLAQMVEIWGNIKEDFLDRSFKMIHPMGEFKKKKNLIELGWDESFIRKYSAIEKWLEDSIPFPGKTYHEFITSFYCENKLIQKEYKLDGMVVDLENITCPILNLVAKGDSIVPPESSLELKKHVGDIPVTEVLLGGGHIGCVISDKHRDLLVSELEDWILSFEKKYH